MIPFDNGNKHEVNVRCAKYVEKIANKLKIMLTCVARSGKDIGKGDEAKRPH